MVSISFSVFKEKILDGTKKQTIRKYNEKRFQQLTNAKTYQLYWGNWRSNDKELLKEVESIQPIIIKFDVGHGIINTGYLPGHNAFVLSIEERDKLAQADGFTNYNELLEWFINKYGVVTTFNEKFIVVRWK